MFLQSFEYIFHIPIYFRSQSSVTIANNTTCHQGGRIWQPFGEAKMPTKNFVWRVFPILTLRVSPQSTELIFVTNITTIFVHKKLAYGEILGIFWESMEKFWEILPQFTIFLVSKMGTFGKSHHCKIGYFCKMRGNFARDEQSDLDFKNCPDIGAVTW